MISVDQAKSKTGEPRSKERGILRSGIAPSPCCTRVNACKAPAATDGGSALEKR